MSGLLEPEPEPERGIRHELLSERGVPHLFGLRDSVEPRGVVRPRQVHGSCVALLQRGEAVPVAADAIVSHDPGAPVGIVTADCVPILACCDSGEVVAAIHAGWRGLAAGVVERGIAVLREQAPSRSSLQAVIGPHIGACCYEVDEPVLGPLRARFGAQLSIALAESAPGRWLLDLAAVVAIALERSGIQGDALGRVPAACTFCEPERFHSYRRDGSRAGRLLHRVAARDPDRVRQSSGGAGRASGT